MAISVLIRVTKPDESSEVTSDESPEMWYDVLTVHAVVVCMEPKCVIKNALTVTTMFRGSI